MDKGRDNDGQVRQRFPIRLRQLAVSLEDPDGFLAALAAPRAT